MTLTPQPRYICPGCRSAFGELTRFCRECGADMHRASALDHAAKAISGHGVTSTKAPSEVAVGVEEDRRLGESNRRWLGSLVDGRYRVMDVLGRGGMGVVYKVEHVRMGKIAAMKVLHRDLAQDPEVILRFEREAHAVSRLVHPHTVQVFDFGTAQGAMYLIMEYVRGQDLQRILDRDGPMPYSRLSPLLTQIGGALQEAHDLGVIHRDLKPDNILVSRTTGGRDFAKVLDFGLAKLEVKGLAPDVTGDAQIVGTPYYMAPEQVRGDGIDARTDIYSLGAMMYRALTGTPVFDARTAMGVLTKHLTMAPDAPSVRAPLLGIDPRVDQICLRALAKKPEERWQSVAEMIGALDEAYTEIVTDASSSGRTRGPATRESGDSDGALSITAHELRRADLEDFEQSIRRRRLGLLLGVSVLVLSAAATTAWFLTRPEPFRSAEAEPNNTVAQANRMALGTAFTGVLGQRLSRTEGDRDLLRIDGTVGTRRQLTMTLDAPPNVDVVLTVRSPAGDELVSVNEGGVGVAERIRRRWFSGPVIIEVGQIQPAPTGFPVENVSDNYTLMVTADAPSTAWEAEPNGGTADANELAPGVALEGYLDSRADVDVLRWTGPAGRVKVTVTASPIPVRWVLADGVSHDTDATCTLATGDTIRLERADRDLPHEEMLPGIDTPWKITVTPNP